jgi:dipeptidyl aminopeptidase/acylaminoacyl peptidase
VAAVVVLAGVALPTAARATPDAVATPTAAGPPALVAWTAGRIVSVAGPDGVGRRVVARVARGHQADLTLSRDGRRLAIVTEESVKVADLTAGGPLRTLARGRNSSIPRWSPDGSRLLLVGGAVRLCDVAAQTPCRKVADRTADEYGATWSPDGTQFAYLRASPLAERTGSNVGDVVRQDATGREHVLERTVLRGARLTSPVSPVWTARGLAWSAWTSRWRDDHITRTATRLLAPDGRVRTITAADRVGAAIVPFTLVSDAPGGDLVGLQYRVTADDAIRSSTRVMRLSPSGVVRPWGVELANADQAESADDEYLGALADGRIAVARERTRAGRDTTSVHLVSRRGPLGPPLAVGSAVAVATAHPNEAIDF